MYVSSSTFEMHMQWLKENYRVVSLLDLATSISHRNEWKEPLCAVTFDDGWYDNYEHAYPILKKYKIPATIFIVGNSVGTSEPAVWDICLEIIENVTNIDRGLTGIREIDDLFSVQGEDRAQRSRNIVNKIRKMEQTQVDEIYSTLKGYYYKTIPNTKSINKKYRKLSWTEMREMQSSDIHFGYHSKSHPMLINIPSAKLEEELSMPSGLATDNGIELTRIFSYPDGKFSQNVIQSLKNAGYIAATSLMSGVNTLNTDLYKLKRINLHEDASSSVPTLLSMLLSSYLK
jgi:peptidoglycan/xylan/chitin deacetylase (PgdA/CDA1 family)